MDTIVNPQELMKYLAIMDEERFTLYTDEQIKYCSLANTVKGGKLSPLAAVLDDILYEHTQRMHTNPDVDNEDLNGSVYTWHFSCTCCGRDAAFCNCMYSNVKPGRIDQTE